MREEHRLLGEQGRAPGVCGDENACARVRHDVIADLDAATVGSQEPGDDLQQRGFPDPVGAQDGQHLAVLDRDVDVESALPEQGRHVHAAHGSAPARRRPAEATTITAATAISSSDNATAASASVSRCR